MGRATLYGPFSPPLYAVGGIGLGAAYWTTKYALSRWYRKPPYMDESVIGQIRLGMALVLMLHCVTTALANRNWGSSFFVASVALWGVFECIPWHALTIFRPHDPATTAKKRVIRYDDVKKQLYPIDRYECPSTVSVERLLQHRSRWMHGTDKYSSQNEQLDRRQQLAQQKQKRVGGSLDTVSDDGTVRDSTTSVDSDSDNEAEEFNDAPFADLLRRWQAEEVANRLSGGGKKRAPGSPLPVARLRAQLSVVGDMCQSEPSTRKGVPSRKIFKSPSAIRRQWANKSPSAHFLQSFILPRPGDAPPGSARGMAALEVSV
mmetsp:Transcript_31209/g.70551  ORF Transcript_31209/g.70551 Transcript_31209/m.70551 type:complete len:318 (-) Transcript_31209:129-1082(-)